MKYLIAHRGNISGINKDRENSPSYILEALDKGFDVEIDVRSYQNKIYLGHDFPQYQIPLEFLLQHKDKLWCHAKDLKSLELLLKHDIHCFWHNNDDYTLTSKGIIWAYPGKPYTEHVVIVDLTNNYKYDDQPVLGVCSDFILNSLKK